jgi:hypothetical protein
MDGGAFLRALSAELLEGIANLSPGKWRREMRILHFRVRATRRINRFLLYFVVCVNGSDFFNPAGGAIFLILSARIAHYGPLFVLKYTSKGPGTLKKSE